MQRKNRFFSFLFKVFWAVKTLKIFKLTKSKPIETNQKRISRVANQTVSILLRRRRRRRCAVRPVLCEGVEHNVRIIADLVAAV